MRGAAPRGAVATEESAGAIRPCTSPTEVGKRGGLRGPRRPARCARDGRPPGSQGNRRQQRVFGRVGSWRHRREAATADLPGGRGAARRPQAGSGPGRSGLPAPLPGHHSTQYGLFFRTGRHRRRGRGSSESPAPLRGREANARPRHAGLPGPAGRHRAAGPGRARAGPDRGLERHPHPRRPRQPAILGCSNGVATTRDAAQHLRPLRRQLQPRLHRLQHRSPGSSSAPPTDGSNSGSRRRHHHRADRRPTLVVGSTSFVLADATTTNTRSRPCHWSSSGVSLTAGTDIARSSSPPPAPPTPRRRRPTRR